MKEDSIKEFLLKNDVNYATHGSIWATIIPCVGAYNHGLGNIMHTNKDHILHINQAGVYIIAIDDNKGLLIEDSLTFIAREDIQTSDIKPKLSKFIFTLTTSKGTLQYKIRKNILGCPWHKENLSFLMLGTGMK